MSFLAKYNQALVSNPLITKCATGAFIYTLSDITAQWIQKRTRSEQFDLARTRKFALYGIGVAIPIYHCWYAHLLPRMITVPCKIKSTGAKLFLDQTFFSAFIINVFFLSMAPINGRRISDGYRKLKREFTSTMVASWKLWLPV